MAITFPNFVEVQLPPKFSFGSGYGPGWSTEVVIKATGKEKRNRNWADVRYRGRIRYVKSRSDALELAAHFNNMGGRYKGFRFKHWLDYTSRSDNAENISSTDQNLGTGDGVTLLYALRKAYVTGPETYLRPIYKPVVGSVLVAVNGVLQTVGVHYTINHTTGEITFVTAPSVGLAVTAGFLYDNPVRFDADECEFSLESGGAKINQAVQGAWTCNLPVIEERPC